MKTKFCKLIVLSVVLLMLAANGLAQANVLSPESTQNSEQRVKRKISFSGENTLTKNYKHSIGVDLAPFAQKLDLDAALSQNLRLVYPDDLHEYSRGFFRKLKPWKILYKYNLNYTSNSAIFLRAGVLGFCKNEHVETVNNEDGMVCFTRTSRDLLCASYGLFAGIEKSYTVMPSVNLVFSADFGYYFSETRLKTIQPEAITEGEWQLGWYSWIEKMHEGAHTLFLSPSAQIEYTLLNAFSVGFALNVNARYYCHKSISSEFYNLYEDGRLERSNFTRIPISERQFSVGLVPSFYISYKF